MGADTQARGDYASREAGLREVFLVALTGDSRAYQRFLKELSDVLRGFFRKRLQSNPDEVEDLVQEVLLAVHQKRHTYERAQPVTAWVFAIAKYKYIDHLRKNRHAHRHDALDDVGELFAPDEVQAQDAARDLDRLLSELPAAHRAAIQSTKLDGLSVQEAAQLHGMSESSVKVSVHRGMKKLASILKGRS